MIFDDAIEQNRKIALSVVSGYDGFNVEVDDNDVINIVVDYGYLYDNFNRLFVDNFFYNSGNIASYDDMSIEAVEHVIEVVENLCEYDDDLYEVLRKIENHSDYISECEGVDLWVGYYADISGQEEEILADKLQDVEFGY